MDGDSPLHTADGITDRIEAALGTDIRSVNELDGGLVGRVFRVERVDHPPVVAKLDDNPLDNEARMLRWLATETELPVPTVKHVEEGLLVMEYFDGDGRYDEQTQRALADHLAALHDVTADAYGFSFDTLSGPFLQSNPWTDSWIDFFREQRILPFARAARDDGSLPEVTFDRVLTLADRLDELLVEPDEPALVHGDIHPGNTVVQNGAVRAVLDPAIYFAHDEIDLSYIARSPEISDAFFDQYQRHRGIDEGYFDRRQGVYNAFHALENVRFFGAERLPRLRDTLDQINW
ncbi:fructosamine kinase family protein [Natranaeroarchaeum sulfidigenes]|uniref:Putative aminoglycoside phosphotransferase n=1 Tax=Natranaeroarchaeum sulfidigenes TaxID=2784880 RepID=A0A897MLH4_9EURY|nr:fructosamine kinase family protein [Natranaeroarchaeum sulfidigenes]QSG01454.1 putative aminoglycoside phosphotransferase [Natranaeroarchaeum sulfidigenes]